MSDYKILLVEDNEKMRTMVRFYLVEEGFVILEAADGPSGERLFGEENPHLVVIDIMIPGFDGLELCRRIRKQSMLPILMLTARAADVDKLLLCHNRKNRIPQVNI